MSGSLSNSHPEPDDYDLLARIAERQPEALLLLYRRYNIRVFSLIVRLVRDRSAAEEILQDTFQRLWEAHHRFDSSQGTLSAWLFTVSRNLSLDYLRKKSRRGAFHVYPGKSAFDPPASREYASSEMSLVVQDVLSKLPLDQRAAIELAYFEGLSHSELAERLDLSVGTVKSRIRLGLDKLRVGLRSCRILR